jgi:hypothetical protein
MNLKVLPPKRFQDPQDPYYDPIRHEPWFHKLAKRRAKNALLFRAYREMYETGCTQKAACGLYGVHKRELRDYVNWANETPRKAISAQEQAILDGAYEVYSSVWEASQPFGLCIRKVSALFGVRGRPIEEMWDIRHDFWPTGYPPHKQ